MRTVKQIKASRRNQMLFHISGMLTLLRKFRDDFTRNYALKGAINVCIINLEKLQKNVYHLGPQNKDQFDYLDSFYGLTQKDVKYECKESNSQSDTK